MLRRRFGLALTLTTAIGAAVSLAAACSDDPRAAALEDDSGNEPVVVPTGICPDAAPEAGEGCALPEGTACAFGACGTRIAACNRGAWRYGKNPPPSASCPRPEPPPAESNCPPCWPAAVTCTYGGCSGADASTNTAVASCPNGTWTLEVTPCNSDAGADVQGDADADAG